MVEKLQPAVVNISTKQRVQVQNPFAGTPFGNLFGFGQGQPQTRQAQSLGSGFIISADGYIVTNNHVVSAGAEGATVEQITVTLTDREEYTAKLVGRDAATDIAVLKIEPKKAMPFVKFGDSLKTNPFVRDKVYVPIGKYGKKVEYKIDIYMETDARKKLEAERLFERIVVSDQEATRLGALIMANFVAFYFWWTAIWE